MPASDVAHLRLANQRLLGNTLKTPHDVVSWFGAVQAQDYHAARWALGLRMKKPTDIAIRQAYDDGEILRTHVLRPTWHFVTPEDIRWMLELTAPRVISAIAYYSRHLGITDALIEKSRSVIIEALAGKKYKMRTELRDILVEAGTSRMSSQQVSIVMMRAELDALVCSGPMRGKQFTYALLDERAPKKKKVDRIDALGMLATRYFTSHSPATAEDFSWWSGLSSKDARTGIGLVHPMLKPEMFGSRMHWSARPTKAPAVDPSRAYLLPVYDEYGIGYTNRSAYFDESRLEHKKTGQQPAYWSMIVMNGRMIGSWRRTIGKKNVNIELSPVGIFSAKEKKAIALAAEEYGCFLDLPVVLD